MHGVSLSIGSVDPLNNDYLKSLKRLMQRIQPKWISLIISVGRVRKVLICMI